MEIANGTAGDRPWAELFATLAFSGEPCELIVEAGPHVHRVAFAHQAVVAASSPLASDSALGIVLSYDVITPAMVPEVATRIASAPGADPIDVLAEIAQLTPETAHLLRRRVIAVAATRVFALSHGSYRATREISLRVQPDNAIDVRALIYEGVRTHLTDAQLGDTIARFGESFALQPDAHDDLPQFGFAATELPVLDALRAGASLADLEGRYPQIGPRGVRAIVSALLAARALAAAPRRTPTRPPQPRASGQVPAQALARSSAQLPAARGPVTGRFAAPPPPTLELAEEPRTRRSGTTDTFELAEQPRSTSRRATGQYDIPDRPAHDTLELAEQPRSRISGTYGVAPEPALELAEPPPRDPPASRAAPSEPPPTGSWAVTVRGAGRTTGAPPSRDTPPPPLRATGTRPAFARAAPPRTLGPTATPRPAPVTRADPSAPVSPDFSVSLRPSRPTLQGTAVAAPEPDAAPAEPSATQHYDRGVALLDQDVQKAIVHLRAAARLSSDVDHEATLAWALFCAAPDKEAVAKATKAALAKAVYQSPNPALAHFYLGRMERMLGRDRESLSHFKTVAELSPRHAAALAEIRTLEARLFPKKR